MNLIELNYVSKVYDEIAEHFSSTRYAHWASVKEYLESLCDLSSKSGCKINFLDFGCGNGKYLSFGKTFNVWAFDNCAGLLEIVAQTYPDVKVIKGNVSDTVENLQSVGLVCDHFDSIISVAVIHHLSTESGRIQMISNIIQLLKSGGTCLITGWANSVVLNDMSNKSKFVKINDVSSDYLVSWNNKYQRYYHLFEPDELEELIEKTGLSEQIEIIKKILECDNWILIFRKK